MTFRLLALVGLLALIACERKPVPMNEGVIAIVRGTALVGADLRPIDEAVIVIEDGRIIAIGPSQSIEIPARAETVDAGGLTLLPGFIDAHVHIAFSNPQEVVANGVTTARDLGWVPTEIWPLVAQSQSFSFDGPRLVAAGQMLTAAKGYPTRAGWAPEGVARVVRPGDVTDAVADQVVAGASIIKVALNADAGPTLTTRTLGSIVEEAHQRNLRVTAHVTGLNELDKAIAAGVDELAHMLMSEERIPPAMIRNMVGANMIVVPTLSVRFGSDQAVAIENLHRFLDAGGRVIYGTDLGNAGPSPGIDAREVDAMFRAGMGGRDIIASATVEAAQVLDLAGTGVLGVGMDADIIAVRGDPLRDPLRLTAVEMVWREGRRHR